MSAPNILGAPPTTASSGLVPVSNGDGTFTWATVPGGGGSGGTAISSTTHTNSYTLVLADAGTVVELFTTSATLTIPPNSSVAFPVGTVIEICALGGTIVTIAPGTSVTLTPPGTSPGLTHLNNAGGINATARIRQRVIDAWVVSGDLS